MVGGMTKTMLVITAVVIILINGTSAQKLVVGDDKGWIKPPSPDFYERWAAKQNFVIGDSLVFVFTTGSHNVAVVTSKEAYDKCDTTLDKDPQLVTKGPLEIVLLDTLQYYFLCTVDSHCASGQKFAVKASVAPSDHVDPPPNKDSAGTLTTSGISATLLAIGLAMLY